MVSSILRNPQMAVNIKDLCGNSGHRFNNYYWNFQLKNTSAYLIGVFLLAVWLDSHPLRFKRVSLPPSFHE